MPANEGGYELPQDIWETILQRIPLEHKIPDDVEWPHFHATSLSSTQEQKLDSLVADMTILRATVNEIKALLWQLSLQAQGVDVTLLPNDQNETSGIISANGLSIKE